MEILEPKNTIYEIKKLWDRHTTEKEMEGITSELEDRLFDKRQKFTNSNYLMRNKQKNKKNPC